MTVLQTVAVQKLEMYLSQISRCVHLLSTDQLWWRANEHCNSVGNLLLHLNGNMRQWICAGLGGIEYDRDRPSEFAERRRLPSRRGQRVLHRRRRKRRSGPQAHQSNASNRSSVRINERCFVRLAAKVAQRKNTLNRATAGSVHRGRARSQR